MTSTGFDNVQVFIQTSHALPYSYTLTAYNTSGYQVAYYQSNYPAAAMELPDGTYLFTVSATYSPPFYPCNVCASGSGTSAKGEVQDEVSLRECVAIMKKNAFSQLPVFSGEKTIGTITETHIITLLSGATEPGKVLNERVRDNILPAFAVVGKDTPVEALFSLFRYLPAVLVASGDKTEGIITKIDLLAAGT
jgi:predicted transcriptional regulator